VAKHAWHSLIFEGLPFYLDMLESINAFQYVEILGDNYTLYTIKKLNLYFCDGETQSGWVPSKT
jgi:hypothetical protein